MGEASKKGLLRVYAGQEVIGAAFLVRRDDGEPTFRALTCAHVVLDALGGYSDHGGHIIQRVPTDDDVIELDFANLPDHPRIQARVEGWYALGSPDYEDLEDVAVLRFELDSIPAEAEYHALRTLDELPGADVSVQIQGFPTHYGEVTTGKLLKQQAASGWAEVKTDVEGYTIEGGYSGGPVWAYDDAHREDVVVGMVARKSGAPQASGYVILSHVLHRALPLLFNPYKGLEAFRERDSKYYYGRSTESEALYQALGQEPHTAAVIGNSGSGKSSLVFAGLVPLLRERGDVWRPVDFRPRGRPFEELAWAVTQGLTDAGVPIGPYHELTERLIQESKALQDTNGTDETSEHQNTLHTLAQSLQRQNKQRLLLIADQFEEIYTLGGETGQTFVRYLLHTLESQPLHEEPTIGLVLTMRGDFFEHVLGDAKFTELLNRSKANFPFIGPIERDDLVLAIEKPAEMQNVVLEGSLVKRILDDVKTLHDTAQGNPQESVGGAELPLLQFALTELWKRQRYENGRYTMTERDYTAIGEVKGALGQHAEAFYQGCRKEHREMIRKVFLEKLIVVRKGERPTKRIESRDSFKPEAWALIQRLNEQRLVKIGYSSKWRCCMNRPKRVAAVDVKFRV